MVEACTLCTSQETKIFATAGGRTFFVCSTCDLKFASRSSWLSKEEELKRYALHENDIHDPGYQKFVQPLVSKVLELIPKKSKGLDYGCGPGPVASHLLGKAEYDMNLYDPYFENDTTLLQTQYDFVICTETVEHFYEPGKDFKVLKSLLRPNGKMFFMTLLWNEKINFETWHYQRDETHVSFYSERTFNWIAKRWEFRTPTFFGERGVVL